MINMMENSVIEKMKISILASLTLVEGGNLGVLLDYRHGNDVVSGDGQHDDGVEVADAEDPKAKTRWNVEHFQIKDECNKEGKIQTESVQRKDELIYVRVVQGSHLEDVSKCDGEQKDYQYQGQFLLSNHCCGVQNS